MSSKKNGVDPVYGKLAAEANQLAARLQGAMAEIQRLTAQGSQQTTMIGALGLQIRAREELAVQLLGMVPADHPELLELEDARAIAEAQALEESLHAPDAPLARLTQKEERSIIGIQFLRDLDSPPDNQSGRLYVVRNGEEQHAAMARAAAHGAEMEKRAAAAQAEGERKVVLA